MSFFYAWLGAVPSGKFAGRSDPGKSFFEKRLKPIKGEKVPECLMMFSIDEEFGQGRLRDHNDKTSSFAPGLSGSCSLLG